MALWYFIPHYGLSVSVEEVVNMLHVCEEEVMEDEARLNVPGTDGQVDKRNSPVFSWSL